ncbi:MAG: DUF58 domain-containing protein [Candidatus Sumerlaeia bacterium]
MARPAPVVDSEFIVWTRRNVVLFLAVLCGVGGVMLGNTALMFWGAVLLLWMAGAAWMARSAAWGLIVQREHPDRLFEGEEFPLRWTFRQTGLLPAMLVEVRDVIPIGERLRYSALVSERIERGGAIHLGTRIACVRGRGVFPLGALQVSAGDPAGIHRVSLSPRQAPESTVFVCPRGHNIEGLDLLGAGVLRAMGLQTRRRGGEGSEFNTLRDYRPGDTQRRIHWRSSQRHQRLLVRESLEDITTEITILCDVRRLSRFGTGAHSTLEYALKTAAHTACTAEAHAHRFGAWFLGDDDEHYPMGGGPMHLLRFLDRLVNVRPRRDFPIERRLADLAPSVGRGATLMLILSSANTRAEALREVLLDWRRRDVKTLVVLLDDASFLKIYPEQQAMLEEAPALSSQAAVFLLSGCSVFTLSSKDSLAARLSRVESLE